MQLPSDEIYSESVPNVSVGCLRPTTWSPTSNFGHFEFTTVPWNSRPGIRRSIGLFLLAFEKLMTPDRVVRGFLVFAFKGWVFGPKSPWNHDYRSWLYIRFWALTTFYGQNPGKNPGKNTEYLVIIFFFEIFHLDFVSVNHARWRPQTALDFVSV